MSTDNVIAGQVVQADDDTAADENLPSAPETYFHKVAGPQRSTAYSPGYTADETPVAADPTATDPDLPVVDTTTDPDLQAAGSDVDELDDTAVSSTPLDDTALDDTELDDSTLPTSTLPTSTLPASSSVTAASEPRESLLGDASTLMEHWRQAAVEFARSASVCQPGGRGGR